MDAKAIESLILASLPDAQVSVEDVRGDGGHYNAVVASPAFAGKTRLEQQRMVHAALKGVIGVKIHNLAIQTIPAEKHA